MRLASCAHTCALGSAHTIPSPIQAENAREQAGANRVRFLHCLAFEISHVGQAATDTEAALQ